MANVRKMVLGIVGGRNCSEEVEQLAHNFGRKSSKVVDIVVCGGLSGTMMAFCQGFKTGKGLTIGIIPSYDKSDANEYIDIVIPTGLGLARNVLVVKSADVIVALPGQTGTLSEIAYALQFGIPVISLQSWDIPGVIKVNTIEQALVEVQKALGNT
ncbi:TIGR00725 family protein [Candidatus Omnitrophota bacterium]